MKVSLKEESEHLLKILPQTSVLRLKVRHCLIMGLKGPTHPCHLFLCYEKFGEDDAEHGP